MPSKAISKTPENLYDSWDTYDAIFGDAKKEMRFISCVMSQHAGKAEKILEPACGSGRLALEMLKAGYRVCGFDQSRSAVGRARREVRKLGRDGDAAFWRGSLENFSIPPSFWPVDAAYCLTCTLSEVATFNQLWRHFKSMAAAMSPRGIYIADFYFGGPCERWSEGEFTGKDGDVVPWWSRIEQNPDPEQPGQLKLIFRIGDADAAPVTIHQHRREAVRFAFRDWFDVIAEHDGCSMRNASESSDVVAFVLRRR